MVRCLLVSLFLAVPVFASPLESLLPRWWKTAESRAAQIPEEDRKPLERAIIFTDFSAEPREKTLQALLFAIALRPQDVRGPLTLLAYAGDQEDYDAALTFLDELYRRRAGIDSRSAMDWQSGRAELLLSLGRWSEALTIQRQLVAAHDADAYDRILLAVLEKIGGNDQPFAKIIAECPTDPDGVSEPGEYCWDVARSIATRVMNRFMNESPKAITDILAGRGGAEKQSWPERMHGLVSLAVRDFEKARPELEAVLTAPDAPDFVKDDAIYLMISGSTSQLPPERMLALIDCWFARRSAQFPPLPDDAWERLRTLPPPKPRPEQTGGESGCMQHDGNAKLPLPLNDYCVEFLLLSRSVVASNLGNQPVLRETAERMLALSIANGGRLSLLPDVLRRAAELRVDHKDDVRAMQYAATILPDALMTERIEKAAREQTQRVLTPWDSPTRVPAQPAASCIDE